ncbi:hypothetical protein [Vreelandella piezotolerans]|uniref:hypothetical protein n=1 Tax=Vreelandella piezotolerans TaxID=2609667 RepID=UPI001C6381FA|nr:hypothetical protein [Halomonas piezotolerans]
MWSGIPGSFAFRIANEEDKKRALKKLGVLVFFSVLPLLCVLLLTLFFPGGPAGNFFEYTQGGQIFFYVGSVMGSVTCLIAFEDVLDLHQDGDIQGEQRGGRETEKLWLIFYLVISSLIALGALMTMQIKGETNALAVNFASYTLYGFSLYFWYVCILYESLKSNYFENEGTIKDHFVDDLEDFDGEG